MRCICLIFAIVRAVFTQYFFRNAEDLDVCRNLDFVEISPFREVSLTQMTWQSAHACCKMKGMALHTIEKSGESEEFPLQKILPEIFGAEAEELQFWIGLSYHKGKFQWTFGTIFPQKYVKVQKEVYRWVEGHPEIFSAGHSCVTLSPYKGILELRTLSCNLKLNFICQSIPRMGGEPMSGHDIMEVGSAEFKEIPGFENLKFSSVYTRWPIANAICQSRNWALINWVHELYGDKLASAIGISRHMDEKKQKVFHSSGHDFCEVQNWQWACGEKVTGTIPWLEGSVDLENPKNNAHCLQYVIQSNDGNATLGAKRSECDELGYVICDTMPSCSNNDQYRCLHQDPQFVDYEIELEPEKVLCKTLQFHPLKTANEASNISYWVTSSKLTWKGANECCRLNGWSAPAPKSKEEMESLLETLYTAENSPCEKENQCDAFWTSTSNLGYLPHSPLRFENGKLLSRSMYSLIRADGFSYPACGRINFLDFQKSDSKYFHADCTEKNLMICEEVNEHKHVIRERRVQDDFHRKEDFCQKRFENFFTPPTVQEMERRTKNHSRDACLRNNIFQKYAENCPNSATKIDSKLSKTASREPSKKAKIAIPYQNKILLGHLVTNAFYESNETNNDFLSYGLRFMNFSVSIFSNLCPIVPQYFLKNSLEMFRMLHKNLNPKPIPELMNPKIFNWTMKLLHLCQQQIKPVIIKHDSCGELAIGEKTCENYICTEEKFEFSLQKTDLLLDILWKVFEAVHAACFPAFKENPMLHHKYAMAITDLWENKEMRYRWSNQVEKKGFWKRFLGPFFEDNILNMERCLHSTVEKSYFRVRLPKPSLPYSVRLPGFSNHEFQSAKT